MVRNARHNLALFCYSTAHFGQIFSRFCSNKRCISFGLFLLLFFASLLYGLSCLLEQEASLLCSEHNNANMWRTKDSGAWITQTRAFPRGGDESLKYDQPWRIAPTKIYSSLHQLDPSQRYIFGNFSYSPGLGNLMFQLAALRVLAEEHNASLVVPSNCLLRKAFGRVNRTVFMAPGALDKILYLHKNRLKEIKFTVLPALSLAAQQNLEEARLQRMQHELEHTALQAKENGHVEEENDVALNLPVDFDETYTFIGIHARHGVDITLNSRNIRHGHTTAPPAYYTSAINHFRSLLPDQKLVFIVSSDDMNWARRYIVTKTKGEVFYLKSKYREVDLATLLQCNHTIISTGTFSWWTAYLNAGGTTVRYAGWPRPNSELSEMVKAQNYFLPEWTAME